MTRSQETSAAGRRKKARRDLRVYRGYIYEPCCYGQMLRLYQPSGEFLCYLGHRMLTQEIRRDIKRRRRRQLTETLPLFREAA